MAGQGGVGLAATGDVKRLLDPRNTATTASRVPPLPGYHPNSQVKASAEAAGGLNAGQAVWPRPNQWLNSPSGDPLPMPAGTANRSPNAGQMPDGQATPVYVPQNSLGTNGQKQPVLIEQSYSAGEQTIIKPTKNVQVKSGPATGGSGSVRVHVQGSRAWVRRRHRRKRTASTWAR